MFSMMIQTFTEYCRAYMKIILICHDEKNQINDDFFMFFLPCYGSIREVIINSYPHFCSKQFEGSICGNGASCFFIMLLLFAIKDV